MAATEDFDRSFDFFEGDGPDKTAWKDLSWTKNTSHETSFESTLFEFSATSGQQPEAFPEPVFFPEDPFFDGKNVSTHHAGDNKGGVSKVHVAIHEQLSAMYDDFSQEGSISVTGSLRVKPTVPVQGTFFLTLRDQQHQIHKLEPIESGVCKDVTGKTNRGGSNRVLRVTLDSSTSEETPIATYSGVSKLRPVPVLIKSRVRTSNQFARVGFKIRANPTNEYPMKNIVIMIAVPPNVDGEKAKMSRRGGHWEELKRTLSWSVNELQPGKALEIQAQFGLLPDAREPKFPILVRCDYPALFSSIEVSADAETEGSTPIRMILSPSSRILHRKV